MNAPALDALTASRAVKLVVREDLGVLLTPIVGEHMAILDEGG